MHIANKPGSPRFRAVVFSKEQDRILFATLPNDFVSCCMACKYMRMLQPSERFEYRLEVNSFRLNLEIMAGKIKELCLVIGNSVGECQCLDCQAKKLVKPLKPQPIVVPKFFEFDVLPPKPGEKSLSQKVAEMLFGKPEDGDDACHGK